LKEPRHPKVGQDGENEEMVCSEKAQLHCHARQPHRQDQHNISEVFFRNLSNEASKWQVDAGHQILEELQHRGQIEHWLLRRDEVVLGNPPRELGNGACGCVLAATVHGSPAVVKIPKKEDDGCDLERACTIINELQVLRRARHPNVVILYGAYIDMQAFSLNLVIEQVQGLDLSIIIQNPEALRNRFGCHCIVFGIWSALRFLHAQQPCVVHGDVKPSNIMVEGWRFEPRARLLDFGLSRLCTPTAEGMGGSVRWMAPELMLSGSKCRPHPSTDIFSAGRLMYYMATGTPPLEGVSRDIIRNLAAGGCVPALAWGKMDSYAQELHGSCTACCQIKPSARPTSAEQHEKFLPLVVHNPVSGKAPTPNMIGADSAEAQLGAVWHFNGDPEALDAISVWCDSMTDGYEIKECTPAFVKLMGVKDPTGSNFLEWLENPHAFDTWVRVTLNEAYNDMNVEVPIDLLVHPPANDGAQRTIRIVCILVVEASGEDPSDAFCVTAVKVVEGKQPLSQLAMSL